MSRGARTQKRGTRATSHPSHPSKEPKRRRAESGERRAESGERARAPARPWYRVSNPSPQKGITTHDGKHVSYLETEKSSHVYHQEPEPHDELHDHGRAAAEQRRHGPTCAAARRETTRPQQDVKNTGSTGPVEHQEACRAAQTGPAARASGQPASAAPAACTAKQRINDENS